MGYSPTRSSPRASWTGWSTAPITCSCRARATAPTSAPAPTGPTRHKEVAQARTLPVGVSDSLIDPLVNSLIVHTGLSGVCQCQLNDNPPLLPVVAGVHPGERAAEQLAGRRLQHAGKVAGTPAKRPVQAAEYGLQRLLQSARRRRLGEDDPGVDVVQRDSRRLQLSPGSCRPQRRHRIGELLEGLIAVELAIGPDR